MSADKAMNMRTWSRISSDAVSRRETAAGRKEIPKKYRYVGVNRDASWAFGGRDMTLAA